MAMSSHTQSIIVCDLCQQILDSPVLIPCEHTVCKSHLDDMSASPCTFCQKKHDKSCVMHLSKLQGLIDKLRLAKESCQQAEKSLSDYQKLKYHPLAFINEHFDSVRNDIERHKARLLHELTRCVEAKCREAHDSLAAHHARCIESLDNKQAIVLNLNEDLGLIKSQVSAWLGEFDLGSGGELKISEKNWENIQRDANAIRVEIGEKMRLLQSSIMLNKSVRFEATAATSTIKTFCDSPYTFGRIVIASGSAESSREVRNATPTPSPTSPVVAAAPSTPTLVGNLARSQSPLATSTTAAKATLSTPFEPSLDAKPKRFTRILGHLTYVYCVCFDRTGQFIFTASDDKLIKVWRALDGLLLVTLRGPCQPISDIDVNYENTLLVAGSNDKKVRLWNLRTTELIYTFCENIYSVTCVRFSPYCKGNVRWLCGAGSDGQINFWKYDATTSRFDTAPIRFAESQKINSVSFSRGGGFLAAARKDLILLYYINEHTVVPIRRLQSNSCELNEIRFANHSLKFMSGGKDGAVRVWYRECKNWASIMIDTSISKQQQSASRSGSSSSSALGAGLTNASGALAGLCVGGSGIGGIGVGVGGGGNVNVSLHNKYNVTMNVWNSDDSLIITAIAYQNEFPIKVWNAKNAVLVHEFANVHTNHIYVLEPHPTQPHLLLSGSHDGYVILWNLRQGCIVEKFYNQIGSDTTHGGICDLKWSPLLDKFAATDSHGNFIVYGYESSTTTDVSACYNNVPSEQFFHYDYRPLVRNKHNQLTIDKKTGLAAHILPPAFLLKADTNMKNNNNSIYFVPCELKYQRMIAGREHMSPDEFAKRVRKIGDFYDFYDDFEIAPNGEILAETPFTFTREQLLAWTRNVVQPIEAGQLKSEEAARLGFLLDEERFFDLEFRENELSEASGQVERKKRERKPIDAQTAKDTPSVDEIAEKNDGSTVEKRSKNDAATLDKDRYAYLTRMSDVFTT